MKHMCVCVCVCTDNGRPTRLKNTHALNFNENGTTTMTFLAVEEIPNHYGFQTKLFATFAGSLSNSSVEVVSAVGTSALHDPVYTLPVRAGPNHGPIFVQFYEIKLRNCSVQSSLFGSVSNKTI
ncbi:hypothetical protein QTP88_015088 [Uroleucon formosanum]